MIRAQLGHLNAHPAASQLLIANLGRAGKLPDIAARINAGFQEPLRRLLADGATNGTLRPLTDDHLGATALFGAVLVIGLRAIVVDGHIDVDDTMKMIGPMFWHGIAPARPNRQREALERNGPAGPASPSPLSWSVSPPR